MGIHDAESVRLCVITHLPSEDTNGLYMVETPALPGCRAWGTTPAEALEYLQDVAAGFVASYRERGIPIPVDPVAVAPESVPLVVPA